MTKLTDRERKKYKKIAKALCYPQETIEKIEQAETEEEAERAMVDARRNK